MDLLHLDNACKVHRVVESVTGLKATSASPTDLYILHCKPATTFDGKPVSNIFVKLCVEPQSLTPEVMAQLEPNLPDGDPEHLLKRLRYALNEYRVYDVVRRMYYNYTCPFFIRVYGIGTRCSYRQVNKLLGRHSVNLKRNLWYTLTNHTQRPAVDDDDVNASAEASESKQVYSDFDPRHELKFNLLLLQYMEAPSVIEVVLQNRYFEEPVLLSKMLFMVGYTCYAMWLNGLCHKDLHMRNVLIESCAPRSFVLVVDTEVYELQDVVEFPRVFDFDRSLVQPCKPSAADLFYFVCHVSTALSEEYLLELAKCFMNPFGNSPRVKQLATYWQQPFDRRSEAETVEHLKHIRPLQSVLLGLRRLANIVLLPRVPREGDVFIARRELVGAPNVREAFYK